MVNHLGIAARPAPQLALCRCGASAVKPACDGTCHANGFSDAKDPERVADRRDTYPGQQVTVFDNRGICQHSGYCSDRLPVTTEQRARWASLASRAADEAGLPADPGFRSALASCLEWISRAPASPPSGGAPAPVPAWDWGPGGPPAPEKEDAGTGAAQPVRLPAPGEPVSFGTHIRPLFRDRDRQSMSFAFDLWSADDVRAHAAGILQRLQDGSMPCDGSRTDPCPATAPGPPTRSTCSGAGPAPACNPDFRAMRGGVGRSGRHPRIAH